MAGQASSQLDRLRTPPLGETWVHIDRFGKRNRRVWAVQGHDAGGKLYYRTTVAVIIEAPAYTLQFDGEQQPKGVLCIPSGSVSVTASGRVRILPLAGDAAHELLRGLPLVTPEAPIRPRASS